MPKLLRAALFVSLLLAFTATTASAQTYELFASESDLTPSGGSPSAQCLVEVAPGTVVFFNSSSSSRGIFVWDGSSLNVHTSGTDLDNAITATSNPVNRCDAVTSDGAGTLYFNFRANGDSPNVNYIYRTTVPDATDNGFTDFDGATGLGFYNSTLYVGGYAFFDDSGTIDNGVYSFAPDLSGSATAVATNGDVSLQGGLDVSSSGMLYAYSNAFSGGNFGKQVLSVDLTASSPSFSVFANPFGSSSPLTETSNPSSSASRIEDLDLVTFDGTEYFVLRNVRDSNPDEFGVVATSDQAISLLFNSGDLTSNLSVSGFGTGFAATVAVNADGQVYVASDGGSAPTYIARVSGAPPLPVELTSFRADRDGQQAVLTWTTATETNNAGFDVQHRAPEAASWSTLGFEPGAGTTTEAQSYRFTTDALEPGVHTFRLRQVDNDGGESFSKTQRVEIRAAEAVTLTGPNPVASGQSLKLTVQSGRTQTVNVALHNVLGQRVRTIENRSMAAGETLDASIDTASLPSGVYFVRVQGTSINAVKRFTIVQ